MEGRRHRDSNGLDKLDGTTATMRGRGISRHTRGVDGDDMSSPHWCGRIRCVPEEISSTRWSPLRRGRRTRLNFLQLLHTCSNKDPPENTPNERKEGLRDVSNALEAIGKCTLLNQIIATNTMLVTDKISGNTKVNTTASHSPRHVHCLLHHMTNGTRHTEEGVETISKGSSAIAMSPGTSVEKSAAIRGRGAIVFCCLIQLIGCATRTEGSGVTVVTRVTIDAIGGADQPTRG